MDFVLWAVILIGHFAIWCVIFNRVHATAFARHVRKKAEKIIILAVLAGLIWFAAMVFFHGTISLSTIARGFIANHIYLLACLMAGAYFILRWIYRKFFVKPPAAILQHSTEIIDVRKLNEDPVYVGSFAKSLEWIPGNQSHLIAVERMTLALQRLPKELHGMKICHLSDFHLTGYIDIGYYHRIVEQVNQFDADLILITGDLIDESPCLDWIAPIFGGLTAKHGVMYVLGNHDKRIRDEPLLRKMLSDAGLIAVNGKWIVREISGVHVAIAGNEIPWFGGAERLQPYQDAGDSAHPTLKLLLSHSPDQFKWAQKFDFDLMLAGHTHGGQIQLPVVGPIVAPSRHGIKYASGTFMMDKMLMHVSRGIAGDECIRINCPPEVGFFTLVGSPEG
jgi:predicted MPP superfamily phosphohydrolase